MTKKLMRNMLFALLAGVLLVNVTALVVAMGADRNYAQCQRFVFEEGNIPFAPPGVVPMPVESDTTFLDADFQIAPPGVVPMPVENDTTFLDADFQTENLFCVNLPQIFDFANGLIDSYGNEIVFAPIDAIPCVD